MSYVPVWGELKFDSICGDQIKSTFDMLVNKVQKRRTGKSLETMRRIIRLDV